MTRSIYNNANLVFQYDTFAGWLTKTNMIIGDMATSVVTVNTSAIPDVTTGNGFVNGFFGANTVYVTSALQGGTANTPSTLSITSNTNVLNVFSVGTPTSNVTVNGTTIRFSNTSTINATFYTATSANTVLFAGVPLATMNTAITANGDAAYSNSVNYVGNAISNGTWVVANALYSSNTSSVAGIPLNVGAATEGYVMTYDAATSTVMFKNPASIISALSAETLAATLQFQAGSNGSGYAANIYGNSTITNISFRANTISLTVDSGAVRINSAAVVTSTLSIGNTAANAGFSSGTLTLQSNSTTSATINSTAYSGSANNATYLSGTTLATIQGQITANAATAYTNAVSVASADATSKAATAYSNAVSVASADATSKAATAYTNAAAYADSKSNTAYSNAIAIAANATNLTSGTVNPQRLGSGTANSQTLLYGNNTWVPVGLLVINSAVDYNWTNVQTFSSNVRISGNTTSFLTIGSGGANITANSSVINVGNSTVYTTINSTSFSGTANNSTYLEGATLATIQSQISTAYSNAASLATSLSSSAYSNAVTFARNASNIDQGTLPAARLSGTYNITSTKVDRTLTGTNSADLVYAAIADNDAFRIRVGGTATNEGYAEIAVADDGTEPIYVRQYSGAFANIIRSASLLDSGGNTSFPGVVTAAQFNGSGAGLTGTASSLSAGYSSSTGYIDWGNVGNRPNIWNDAGWAVTGYMRVDTYLNVGTTVQRGRISVDGQGPGQYLSRYTWMNYTAGGVGSAGPGTVGFGIWSEGRIGCQEFNATSDRRLKKNIRPLTANEGIDFIKKVPAVIFDWKDEQLGVDRFGFIAQDAAKAGYGNLLAATAGTIEGDIDEDGFESPERVELSMSYDQVVPLLTVALKDALEQIDLLKEKVADLEAKVQGNI